MGGAHTSSYVTVLEDGSDRYNPKCLRHKYSKVPAWMFHGAIVDGRKGPSCFWEKGWGTINSACYNEYILTHIKQFFRDYALNGYLFMQDNASAHQSYETRLNLLNRYIPWVKFPPYSPDLNLIEHVWNWMKN